MSPTAILLSDVHFSLNNLSLASESLSTALAHAEKLDIPLIICGDLNDTKAIIRAEVANELIDIFKKAETDILILVGNHDLINEKGKEHSLRFLNELRKVSVVHRPMECWGFHFLPYFSDPEEFKRALNHIPHGATIICHQGVKGAFMGDYIQDKSSTEPSILEPYTVFSGHYHRHQRVGTVTYIGNPYTMSFGEANDGPKGYLVLNDDGSFERVDLKLRRHVIKEYRYDDVISRDDSIGPNDIVWVKVSGPASELDTIDKKSLGDTLLGHSNFKLDLIADVNEIDNNSIKNGMTNASLLDTLIDQIPESEEYKDTLKSLWREICDC